MWLYNFAHYNLKKILSAIKHNKRFINVTSCRDIARVTYKIYKEVSTHSTDPLPCFISTFIASKRNLKNYRVLHKHSIENTFRDSFFNTYQKEKKTKEETTIRLESKNLLRFLA